MKRYRFNMQILCVCVPPVLFLCALAAAQTDEVSSTTEATLLVDETPGAAPLNDELLPDNTLCGVQVLRDRARKNVTDMDEFPWLVALRYTQSDGSDGGFRCSGTLISERYVLTSAECLKIDGFTLEEVRLGQWSFSNENGCSDTKIGSICPKDVVNLKVTKKTRHPFYNAKTGAHNIALLRLENVVNYTDFIRAICLPPNEYPIPSDKVRMSTAGWGVSNTGEIFDVKLKLPIFMGEVEQCAAAYRKNAYVNIYQACIGNEGDKKECDLSSGSPIMRTYQRINSIDEEQFFQEGIISKTKNCRNNTIPNLYTRVPSYVNWIINNLED